jgi:hypothetical protein
MSIRSPERDGKVIVAVGILVLLVVAGTAGATTPDAPPGGVSIDQKPGEVEVVIVDPGNADSLLLKAPNGNRSIPLKESRGFGAGTSITIVETPEDRTVPAKSYLTTGDIKTEEQTCWMRHGDIELGDSIEVNHSVDIPCDGGNIAGSQGSESIGQCNDTVLIEPGQRIEYQDGTYEVLYEVGGEERIIKTFTVKPDDTGNSLYGIIAAAVLVMAALLVAVGLREVFTE